MPITWFVWTLVSDIVFFGQVAKGLVSERCAARDDVGAFLISEASSLF